MSGFVQLCWKLLHVTFPYIIGLGWMLFSLKTAGLAAAVAVGNAELWVSPVPDASTVSPVAIKRATTNKAMTFLVVMQ